MVMPTKVDNSVPVRARTKLVDRVGGDVVSRCILSDGDSSFIEHEPDGYPLVWLACFRKSAGAVIRKAVHRIHANFFHSYQSIGQRLRFLQVGKLDIVKAQVLHEVSEAGWLVRSIRARQHLAD
jgi:hypothetical protein